MHSAQKTCLEVEKRQDDLERAIFELREDVRELKELVMKLNGTVLKTLESRVSKLEKKRNGNIEEKSTTFCYLASTHTLESNAITPTSCNTRLPMTILEAAELGDEKSLQQMLDAGACIQQRNANGDTALHVAAGGGHVEVVKILLKAGATVDAFGIRMHTPLHRAASGGHYISGVALLKAGVKVDPGASTCHRSEAGAHTEVVRELLNAGANLKLKDADGNTPLKIAVEYGVSDVVFVLLLQEKKAVEKHVSSCGKHLERTLTFQDVYAENLLECARNLSTVLAFEDVYPGVLKSCTARLALHGASHDGNLDAVRALLDCMTFQVDDLNLALRYAVEHDHSECAELLLERGADKNYSFNGKRILDVASSKNHEKCVGILLRAGAQYSKETATSTATNPVKKVQFI